ncbi:hypothetical protein D0867_08424 [Hortaea werneckii]|uniref:Uncharacterized protein n=1 Tax=Hortaea werneckii TaxID=91943 RepID=A0A3M6Z4U2_HORWE|nr:hypothetical protein D0867_08424 [Hortaea werneckii]RMY27799.1 hypothetical protein D0866_09885 [Hortaea werneckii]
MTDSQTSESPFDTMYQDDQGLSEEQPPPYTEATKNSPNVKVSEKEVDHRRPSSKAPSRMSTLKGILTGEVQRHNPRLRDPTSLYPNHTYSSPPKEINPAPKQSTLKSILTGDVHKHNPRLKDPMSYYPELAYVPREQKPGFVAAKRSKSSSEQSTSKPGMALKLKQTQ